MKFIYSCQTDIGVIRTVNQDALVVKHMNKKSHSIILAAVCDGVGGLQQGEVASRKAVEMFSKWFDLELPQIIEHKQVEELMLHRCKLLFSDINKEIYYYNRKNGISSGTTISMVLLWDYRYLVGHLGDSRVYEINSQYRQITTDHTWVAREVLLGNMTMQEAQKDDRKNVILKCAGISPEIEVDFFSGILQEPSILLLCTDGFWHHMCENEWTQYFSPKENAKQENLSNSLFDMVEQLKRRGETDNITAITINVF